MVLSNLVTKEGGTKVASSMFSGFWIDKYVYDFGPFLTYRHLPTDGPLTGRPPTGFGPTGTI